MLASTHLIRSSLDQDRIFTAATCTVFTILCTYYLINAAYRDPGLIRARFEEPVPRDHLWCDFCQNYQPPGGAHCPQCHVCIAGYDHHCVWMGTCIGRNNFQQFVRFNLSWLAYLMYAIVWVSVVAPILTRAHHHGEAGVSDGDA